LRITKNTPANQWTPNFTDVSVNVGGGIVTNTAAASFKDGDTIGVAVQQSSLGGSGSKWRGFISVRLG
jgi:hypothetical protein